MGVINSIPRPGQVNLDASEEQNKRVKSSSDEKVSSIAKDRISTLGRIFRVTLRLTLVVILLPAFLLKSIYDMALLVIKGKKSEQKIDENLKLIPESKKEETKKMIQDLPLETPSSAIVIKEPEHDHSKDLESDKSDKQEEILSPLPTSRGCYEENQKELEALLNPFVDRKEIEKQTPPSNQLSFSLSDILGYFKPLIFSTNKKSSERDMDELTEKFHQIELNESPDLQKKEVKQKKVRFEDEVQQTPSPLESQILYSFISDAQKIDVVEKKEKQAPKKPEPEQKQPVRTSARLAEKKEKSLPPLVQTPPKRKEAPKKPEPEQKQPVRTSARLTEKKEKSLPPLVQTPPKKKEAPKKPEPEQKQPVRTSARLAEKKEKQAAKAAPVAPASSKKTPVKKDKPKEPEAAPSLRRSARLAAKK